MLNTFSEIRGILKNFDDGVSFVSEIFSTNMLFYKLVFLVGGIIHHNNFHRPGVSRAFLQTSL